MVLKPKKFRYVVRYIIPGSGNYAISVGSFMGSGGDGYRCWVNGGMLGIKADTLEEAKTELTSHIEKSIKSKREEVFNQLHQLTVILENHANITREEGFWIDDFEKKVKDGI